MWIVLYRIFRDITDTLLRTGKRQRKYSYIDKISEVDFKSLQLFREKHHSCFTFDVVKDLAIRLIKILLEQNNNVLFTFCLVSHPGVYVFSGLLCSFEKVKLFHLCLVKFAAEIFERLGETERYHCKATKTSNTNSLLLHCAKSEDIIDNFMIHICNVQR